MKRIKQQSSRRTALFEAVGILLVLALSAACLLPLIPACSGQGSLLVQKGVATPFHSVRRCDVRFLPVRQALNLVVNFGGPR